MKKLIKQLLREELDKTPDNINEAAKGISDLPEDAGLFVSDNSTWLNFILYSKSEDKIYGAITTSNIGKTNKYQQVGRVAAEKGYGPLMYEMAMSYINPSFLMPSRDGDIRSEAWNVWEKFYQRSDINKKQLPIKNDLFSFVIVTGDNHEEFESIDEKQKMFDELSAEEQKGVIAFNTMYQYQNQNIFKLIDKANEIVKNGEVDINKLKHSASDYFQYKYF